MSVYGLHSVPPYLLVQEKQTNIKIPSEWFEDRVMQSRAKQNKKKTKKNSPADLESIKLEFHWSKTEQNRVTSRTKQSI